MAAYRLFIARNYTSVTFMLDAMQQGSSIILRKSLTTGEIAQDQGIFYQMYPYIILSGHLIYTRTVD